MNQNFDILYLDELYQRPDSSQMFSTGIDYFMILGTIVDFLRKASIRKGRVLFVEEDDLLDSTSPKSLVGEYIILALSRILNISAYEVYTAIRTRNPMFDVAHLNLRTISTWCMKQIQIQNYLKAFPTLECMCGACSIILKRQFANASNMYTTSCNCMGNTSFEGSNCPSPGCLDFIMYMKKFSRKVKYDRLKWGYIGREDFILGPRRTGIIECDKSTDPQRQILTASLTIDENAVPLENQGTKNTERVTTWQTYKCKYCYVWMYAYNQDDDCFAVLMNNQVKFPRPDILNTDGWKDGL